ncbi:MAG: Na+-translocating ferredoxin:NAD+ oxidoreductase subunit B [Treponematales bacterium]
MSVVIITAVFALTLAFVLGLALGFFRRVFAVPESPLLAALRDALPGANCGACGFPGCEGYAAALAAKTAAPDRCSVGGAETAAKLAALLGVDARVTPLAPVVACRGWKGKALPRGEYTGLATCRGAKIASGGTKLCAWGCVGFGDCVKVCRFGALRLGAGGVPVVDYEKCSGCGLCAAECPQSLILMLPAAASGPVPLCSNRNPVRGQTAKQCKSGCVKCGLCVKACPRQCLTLKDGLPEADMSLCTSCGLCAARCPVNALALLRDKRDWGDGESGKGKVERG